jgi:dihydroorotase
MDLLLRGGRLVNPADGTDALRDIFIRDGKIKNIAFPGKINPGDARTIDLKGKVVFPGFIDLHVHLRDPGQTAKEDVNSGVDAASHGGFTTVLAMPNTTPVCDNPDIVKYVHEKAKKANKTRVFQIGSVTRGMKGQVLSDIEGMKSAGILALSEDGKSVMNSEIARRALIVAKNNDLPVFSHCEDINLVNGGVMNDGEKSRKFGLPGITNSTENVIIARNIFLAEETGARLHLCHCSTKESYLMVKMAKDHGIPITAEVTPHHFTLTEDDVDPENSFYKMNPPLRTKEDRAYLRLGLKEGVFDCISTDHAPHTLEEKKRGFLTAPFGITGLETAASLCYTELVLPGILSLRDMAEKMSLNPSRIIGRNDLGDISIGKRADLTVFDPERTYKVEESHMRSRGKNSPFIGMTLSGKVIMTIRDGNIIYDEDQ